MPPVKNPRRSSYTQEALQQAILAVDGGMSVSAAAKQFDIPRQSLKDKVSGLHPVGSRIGRPSILSTEEEKILVDWVIAVGAAGFPISKDQILSSVEKLMGNLKRQNPFGSGSAPGEKWFALFLQRHPEISARISQALTTSRASVTEAHIKSWFAEVRGYIEKKNMLHVFEDPSRIFNCDESAFFLCPKGKKVYVKKGERHVYTITGNDEKECLTTLVMANAAGDLAPPMVVFNYERVPATVVSKFPETWGIGKSESGWMTGETFFEYISNVFYPWLVHNNIPRPIVLFVDGHNSHLTLHLSEFCSAREIELISLYPNATHILQPMDVAVFHPVKGEWKKTVERWRCENGAAKIKKEDFAPLLKSVLDTSIKAETLKNGFTSTGLLSLDSSKVDFFKNAKGCKIKSATKQYSFSKWLSLRDHLRFIEERIDEERLRRFNENTINPDERVMFDFWQKCTNEVNDYRKALDDQQRAECRQEDISQETNKEEDNNTTQGSPGEEVQQEGQGGSGEPIVIATNSDGQVTNNDVLKDIQFGTDWDFDFPIEMDLPVTNVSLSQIATPSPLKSAETSVMAPSNIEEVVSDSVMAPSNNEEVVSNSVMAPSKNEDVNLVTELMTSTPEKPSTTPAQLHQKVPTPFKKALFWPGESQNKKKKVTKKIRLPSAVTSDEWKNYYSQLEEKKKEAQLEKEKRKEVRELKAKIKKEKEETKVNEKKRKMEDLDDEELGVKELPLVEEPLKLDIGALRSSNWIVVPYNVGNEMKNFVGQILNINDDDTVQVKFLEKKLETNKYVWPNIDDIDCVPKNEVTQILREPTFDRWGYLSFSDCSN